MHAALCPLLCACVLQCKVFVTTVVYGTLDPPAWYDQIADYRRPDLSSTYYSLSYRLVSGGREDEFAESVDLPTQKNFVGSRTPTFCVK